MKTDFEIYMQRCLDLAQQGIGWVAPNPMVGAVLVCENKIIGEGYHQSYGEPHAEVNAVSQVIAKGNEKLLPKSVLFVSLEPCTHQGKTPPCTDLIIKHKIPHVVIGCEDPFPEVNGKGIDILKEAGIRVDTGILEKESRELNRRFITFHTKKRPYVILKFAQSADHFLAPLKNTSKKISNDYTDKIVHKWRSEETAILVGTRTAEADNPFLTVRKWEGKNPVRVVIDQHLRLKKSLNLFDASSPTIVINSEVNSKENNIEYVCIRFSENIAGQVLSILYDRNILSVIVEGGRILLNQFIEKKLWDEARIITSGIHFEEGIPSPKIHGHLLSESNDTGDEIVILKPETN